MFWKVHAGNYGFFSDSVSGDAISFYCCYALPQTSFKLPSLVCAKHHEHENRSCWNKTPWSSHAHNFFLWKTGNNRWTKPEPPVMLLCPSLEGAEHLDWWQCYHCPQRTDPRQHRAKGAGWDPNREKEKKKEISLQVQVMLLMLARSLSLQGKLAEMPCTVISCFQCTAPVQNS